MDWEEGIHSHIQLAITKHVHLYETFANSIILYTKCHYVPKYYHFLFSQTVTVCNMLFWKGSLPDFGYSFTVSHHKNKGGKKKGGVLEIQAYKIQGHRSPISFSLITGLHLHFTYTSHFPRNKALQELLIFTHWVILWTSNNCLWMGFPTGWKLCLI